MAEHRCVPPIKPTDGQRWRCPGCSSRFIALAPRDAEETSTPPAWKEDLDLPMF